MNSTKPLLQGLKASVRILAVIKDVHFIQTLRSWQNDCRMCLSLIIPIARTKEIRALIHVQKQTHDKFHSETAGRLLLQKQNSKEITSSGFLLHLSEGQEKKRAIPQSSPVFLYSCFSGPEDTLESHPGETDAMTLYWGAWSGLCHSWRFCFSHKVISLLIIPVALQVRSFPEI